MTESIHRTIVTALAASAMALAGIAGWEGYRQSAYLDPGGVPTIGYGSTAGVELGDTITPQRAVQRLAADADAAARGIAACLPGVALAQHEFDAYVSFAYNIGVPRFCASTLAARLRATPPDYARACAELLKWVKGGGQVQPGLVRRRQAEYRQCMGIAP